MNKKNEKEIKNGALPSEDAVKEDLEALRKKALERDEFHNKWLSALAECDNMRKRVDKEKINSIKFANEDIIMELFPIMDAFDSALALMDKAEDKMAVIDGIKMVQKQFHKTLESNGVVKIKTDGAKFDPHMHEAAETIETDKYPDGAIIEEMRPGYMLNGRLIRPAQVKVAKTANKNLGETPKNEQIEED